MRNMMSAALIAAGALLGWSGGAVAAADSPCTALGGAIQDDQMCNVQASTSTYTLNMTFPVDYPDQALTDFVTQNRDGFVNVAQTSSQTSSPREVPYQMEVTSEQYPLRPTTRCHPERGAQAFRRSRWSPPVYFL